MIGLVRPELIEHGDPDIYFLHPLQRNELHAMRGLIVSDGRPSDGTGRQLLQIIHQSFRTKIVHFFLSEFVLARPPLEPFQKPIHKDLEIGISAPSQIQMPVLGPKSQEFLDVMIPILLPSQLEGQPQILKLLEPIPPLGNGARLHVNLLRVHPLPEGDEVLVLGPAALHEGRQPHGFVLPFIGRKTRVHFIPALLAGFDPLYAN
mmetsp:Transcript_15319/g.36736  ORF Transcript_15319/g.36736 Transcript_15319/m.36736 type:complete len:205 (+) Transcript_15319:1066-1680(+)